MEDLVKLSNGGLYRNEIPKNPVDFELWFKDKQVQCATRCSIENRSIGACVCDQLSINKDESHIRYIKPQQTGGRTPKALYQMKGFS